MSERLALRIVDAAGLAPWASQLAALEAAVTYPLGDGADRFFIDHGARYHPFFSGLGDPRFLLALDGDRVVGALCGVFREALDGHRRRPTAYLCDLKVAPSHRGTGLARRMALFALGRAATDRSLWRWRIAWAAAMRDARGDVTRSMRGAHAGRLLTPAATLSLTFAQARVLASLDPSRCPPVAPGVGLDLSPDVARTCRGPGLTDTAGRKDLRLVSTGAPWPLVHLALGPAAWGPSLGRYLRDCGRALVDEGTPDLTTCFALDTRLAPQLAWLRAQGVAEGAVCTVYALRLARPWSPPWVHLATSEI